MLIPKPEKNKSLFKGILWGIALATSAISLGYAWQSVIKPSYKEISKLDNIPHKMGLSIISGKYNPIVRLTHEGKFFCTGTVVDPHFIVTAAHCVIDKETKKMTEKKVTILDQEGLYVGQATVAGVSHRVDYAILIGDFNNFDISPIEPYKEVFFDHPKHMFMACGYAFGQKILTCSNFIPIEPWNWGVKGVGVLRPGMSGGPVIDLTTKKIVAVNTSVGESAVNVTPLVGILGAFKIEP